MKPAPLADARLAEIRGRLAPVVAAHGDRWKAVPWHVTEGPPEVRVERNGAKDYLLCCPIYDSDAAFIAHAPADIAALLAEVDRLRAALTHISGPVAGSDLEDIIQRMKRMARAALGEDSHG